MYIKRLLIVDDEPPITRFLKKHMEATGRFEARAVNTAREALETAKEFKPHVVLLDVMMPDMDGGELKSKLLKMRECRGALIIYLTAVFKESDKNDKDLFIAKPVDIETIVAFIDEQIEAACTFPPTSTKK